MASLEPRPSPAGTSYRVKWRESGVWQSETFGPDRKSAALRFRRDVEQNDNSWPEGWLKGLGYRAELDTPAEAHTPLLAYALPRLSEKTGIDPATKTRYVNQMTVMSAELDTVVAADPDTHPSFGSVQNLTPRHVARWINMREATGSSPKTIANWHGLLYQVLQTAVEEGLRTKNPCATTGKHLPRRDGYQTEETHTYLTEAEFALIGQAMWPGLPDPDNGGVITAAGSEKDLAMIVVAVGTGARWGELTALTGADFDVRSAMPAVSIQKAWKRNGVGPYARPNVGRRYLGAPKTTKGRRRVRVGSVVVSAVATLTADRQPGEVLFTGSRGGPVNQPHFYVYRWKRAVALAQRNGLTKNPRFHDLRHTYAAWLISANVPLPEIQRRLGHESIQTTIGTYGGLLEQAGDLADRTVDLALNWLAMDEQQEPPQAQAS